MIILKPENIDIKLYMEDKNKTMNSNDKDIIHGNFKLKNENNKIIIYDLSIEEDLKIVITKDELLKILKKQDIIITKENDTLTNFMKQEQIKYKTLEICEECIKDDKIKTFIAKEGYTFNNTILCKSCAKKLLNHIIYQEGYVDYMNKRYDMLLIKYHEIEKIIEIMNSEYNPINNPDLTLYDILPATEEEYEKVHINDLEIPAKLKNILNKRIDTLMPVQIEAIKNGLLNDENLLVVSQTASGKTLIAELAGIPKAMKKKKMIYLTPLVALANQKYHDFKREYEELGLNIIIKVGQNRIKDNEELYIPDEPVDKADIIVATYEGLDFILRSGNYKDLEDLGIVIIDEIHMLENEERGHRLNGLIHRLMNIFNKTQIIGLSATIANDESLADEFNMKLVKYDKRPVKIERHLVNLNNENEKNKFITIICQDEFDKVSSKGFQGQTIIFTDSRRKTHIIAKRLRKKGVLAEYYHAGLSYSNKLKVEEAFLNQEISTVVTTSALANGVDFPSSTVIFESLRMGIEWITNNEFHQMIGRAGRPLYHDIGKVFIVVNNEDNYSYNDYDMALNLLKSNVDTINVLYNELDVYEQVLSDICAIHNVNVDCLRKYYDGLRIPITFREATDYLLDKKMIVYDEEINTYHPTEYGMAISKSFINVIEAEHIRNSLYDDIFDTVLFLEQLKNAYFSPNMINKLSKSLDYNVGIRLFSDYNKEIIYHGNYIDDIGQKLQNNLINIFKDFMDCDCLLKPYCNCLEINISSHIINRRLQGWSPSEISKEFSREYDILIYSGDIYSYLDQVIMKLESIKRIAKAFNASNTSNECNKLIEKIENGG